MLEGILGGKGIYYRLVSMLAERILKKVDSQARKETYTLYVGRGKVAYFELGDKQVYMQEERSLHWE